MGTHPIFESDFDCLTEDMIEVGYWKIRGLIGGVRVLLEHVGEEWKETFYEAHLPEGADPNDFSKWDRNEWVNVKKTDAIQSTYAFPNLPWMSDGDVHLTQSTAILKYICRKHKIGTELSDTEAWRVDQGADQIVDVRSGFVGLCYGFRTPFDKREEYCNNTLKPQLKQLDAYMEGHKFVSGNTLTYVDFMFWEILDHMYRFDDSMFADFKNLLAFKSNFEALPKVAAYIKSDRFMVGPCNNKMAKWGGDAELNRSW